MKAGLLLILGFVFSLVPLKGQEVNQKELYGRAIKEYQIFEEDHGHYIQTPNVRMHYSTWGNPKDTPFVWIHGTYQNSTEILELVDSWVEESLYVIAIDYYGHGLTPTPEKQVSVYHVADDINFLLENLGISKTIIGGWSRGGTIASAFYETYPDKIKGIVLEDGGSANWIKPRQLMPRDEVEEWYTSRMAHRKDTVFNSQFEAFSYHYRVEDGGSQFWLLAYLKSNQNDQWNWNLGLSEWLEETTLEQCLDGVFKPSTCTLFKSSTLMFEPLVAYRNLNVPLLIIDPTKDDAEGFVAMTAQNEELKALHPDLITHLIYEDATHSVHYQFPEKFSNDVMDFIENHNLKCMNK